MIYARPVGDVNSIRRLTVRFGQKRTRSEGGVFLLHSVQFTLSVELAG